MTTPDEPRFPIFPTSAPIGVRLADVLASCLGATVRRGHVIPDPDVASWAPGAPSFDGFALFDQSSSLLARLFVTDPASRCVLEWRIGRVRPRKMKKCPWQGPRKLKSKLCFQHLRARGRSRLLTGDRRAPTGLL